MGSVCFMNLIASYFHQHKISAILAAALVAAGLFMIIALTGHSWLGLALIFAAALLVFYPVTAMLPTVKFLKTVRIAVTLLVLVGFGYFCAVESFIIRDARTDTAQPADYIIVLGAGVNGTVPSLSLRDRLVGTYDYMTANPNCIAVVSGGQGPGEDITEARCMYDWLVSKGIAPERILMEEQATSTLENLRYSMEIISAQGGTDSVIGVVSSEYHLHRAKLLAERVGIDALGIAARTSYPTVKVNYFIREAFAMTELYVFGAE